MGVQAKRRYKKSLKDTTTKYAKTAGGEKTEVTKEATTEATGFSEEENDDWRSDSDEDKLESTEIKRTKLTKDDIISGELEGLKETAELFKSNIFKLEIEELLTEVSVNYAKHKPLELALHHLKAIFDSVPKGEKQKLVDFATDMLEKHQIKVPFPDPQPDHEALHSFEFEKPSSVHIVGGYALKTIVKSKTPFNVDMAIEMPSNIFQEKDYANYRYFHKRACYLSVLAAAIKSSNKRFEVEFSTLNGDLRRPILLVKPAGDKSNVDFTKTKCVIRILPSISNHILPIHRLAPGKNCVKTSTKPTPHYNASLLMDTSYVNNLAFLYQHGKNSPEFKNAILLSKVWMHQRGIAATNTGFNPFIFAMLMGYLIQGNKDGTGKKLSSAHSSYQLLRGTLDFIANHDFIHEPVFIGESDKAEFSKEEFAQHYDVCIIDPSGHLNIAATMTSSGLAQVQHEAKLAMSYFNDTVDRFEALFLKKVNDPKSKYDNIACIPYSASIHTLSEAYDECAQADYHSYLPFFVHHIDQVLKRGLTNRVDLIAVQYTYLNNAWSLDGCPNIEKDLVVTIGLLLNPDNAPRLVDQGPQSQDDEAVADFKKFWGNKSELRRFKDGSILESVVWQTQGYENRSLIVQDMVKFLLRLHLSLKSNYYHYWAGQFYHYLNPAKGLPSNLFSPQLKNNAFHPVMSSFTQFTKKLREVDEALPLMINNVYPASASLRYSTVTLPHPVNFDHFDSYPSTCKYFEAIDVVVQIEGSSKFPDDLGALQKVKSSFLLKIGDELKSRFGLESTVVIDAREQNPYAIRSYLDVYHLGYVFRCHICLSQEEDLLKRAVNSKTADKLHKELAKEAHQKYLYQLRYKQSHTFYIQALCAKYTAFSSTVRLTKRWFGAHLLSSQVPEELMELFVAHVFLEPQPWTVPTSTFSAFSRVLTLLATWDWQNTPLIVDYEGEMTVKDREAIVANFNQHRRVNPQMTHGAMTVVTAKDLVGHRWSNEKPNRPIAARTQALAKAAVKLLDEDINHHGDMKDLHRLFVTPMDDYNVVLELDIAKCTRYYQNMNPDIKYFVIQEDVVQSSDKPYPQFDPVTDLVNEIERIYGQTVMVFYDKYGGNKLALVWNPVAATPVQWRVGAGFNMVPVDMNKKGHLKPAKGETSISKMIAPNYDAILAEIKRIASL
ncbi:Nrap protein [Pilobolus umbonatus]|nr:Nrap protein [Pilobolus umbonatus]